MGSKSTRNLWDGAHRLRLKGNATLVRRAGTEAGGNDGGGLMQDVLVDGASVIRILLDFINANLVDIEESKLIRVDIGIKPLKRIRKANIKKRSVSTGITTDDILDTWYVDKEPTDCCFVKHVYYKGRLYQLVAGFDPETDGLYHVREMQLNQGGDGVLYMKLEDFDFIAIGSGTDVLRRQLVSLGIVTNAEFTKYFCYDPDVKRTMAKELLPIKVIS